MLRDSLWPLHWVTPDHLIRESHWQSDMLNPRYQKEASLDGELGDDVVLTWTRKVMRKTWLQNMGIKENH